MTRKMVLTLGLIASQEMSKVCLCCHGATYVVMVLPMYETLLVIKKHYCYKHDDSMTADVTIY